VRVNTWTGAGWTPSQTLSFTTPKCVNFSNPSNPAAEVLGPNSVKFSWTKGQNNLWFCVDTAQSESDLTGYKGTFQNFGCLTTSDNFTSDAVPCGKKQWFRIYAVGPGGTSGYSSINTYTTPDCVNFTVPTDLDADLISGNKVRFEWEGGSDNLWFCVETAKDHNDLMATSNTWETWGCGTTTESLEVPIVASGASGGLVCNTTYYWRVFARGTFTNGASASQQVQTGSCS
jgi:hypothetical protein